jgi:hypothetical protein
MFWPFLRRLRFIVGLNGLDGMYDAGAANLRDRRGSEIFSRAAVCGRDSFGKAGDLTGKPRPTDCLFPCFGLGLRASLCSLPFVRRGTGRFRPNSFSISRHTCLDLFQCCPGQTARPVIRLTRFQTTWKCCRPSLTCSIMTRW